MIRISHHILFALVVSLCLLRSVHGSHENLRRRATNNSTIDISRDNCEKAMEESNFEFSEDMAVKVLHAAELSALTYSLKRFQRPNKGDFDSMRHFMDFDDVALVARRGNVCYTALRGTKQGNLLDIWQIFDSRTKRFAGCKVRKGFYRAYFANYYNRFMSELEDCMQPENRELVITGHSQGGSNAMIAYLDLQHYNPLVFTFGAMRAYVEKCDAIDSSRIYRFNIVGDGLYDGWSNCEVISGAHMGHSILLAANSTSPVTYLGLDEDVTRTPSSRDVHAKELYWDALQHMVNQSRKLCSSGPILCRGWEDGHWCTNNDECLGSCDNGYCKTFLGIDQ